MTLTHSFPASARALPPAGDVVTTSNHSYAQAARAAIIAFVQFLYQDAAGYVELVAGELNAAGKIDLVMSTRRWLYFDPARLDLAETIADEAGKLAARYGNVYVGARLYDRRAKDENRRAEAYTLPSRVIFTDDAPHDAPLPWSAYIQTSEKSGHGYILCDRPVTKGDARRVAAALGCDPSGVDLTQLVRLPGTYNTKRGGRFLVRRVGERRAAAVSLDLLRETYPAPAGGDDASGGAWGEHYAPELWEALPNGAALWRSGRVASVARAPHRAELAALLRGERVTLVRDGKPDDSGSAQVACLVFHLMGANFPEVEVRAIADYLHNQLRPNRSKEHYQAHVDAEIFRYRPRNYSPQPTQYVAACPAGDAQPQPAALPPAQHKAPPKSRARKDRPRKVEGAAGYLAWLVEQAGAAGVLLQSQAECAAALGCSLRTIKRYEAALRGAGAIERAPYAQRQAGRLFILRGDNIPETNAIAPVADVVTADVSALRPNAENANAPRAIESTLAPPGTCDPQRTDAPPPDVATVEHIRLAPPGAPLGDVISAALDLVQDAGRNARRRLVLALVEAECSPVEPRRFLAAYRAELDRRKLATLDKKRLTRELKKRERYAAKVQREAAEGKAADGQAWATGYAMKRAADMLITRTGTPTAPDYGPDGRMVGGERAELAALRDTALDARDTRMRRDYERGRLDAAIYGPARPRRDTMTPAIRDALAGESEPQPVEVAAPVEVAPALGDVGGGSVLSQPAGPPEPLPTARGLLARLYAKRDGDAPEHLRDALAA